MFRYLLLILIWGSSQFGVSAASYIYDFNARCRAAYESIFSLRIEEGLKLLEAEKKANPDNLVPVFLEDYADFFVIYISEDENTFSKLDGNKNSRLDLLKKGDKNSPYHLYFKAEIYLHWAFARLKFNQYFTSFREARKAFILLEENQARFPDFLPNKKSLALLHAIVGTIPNQFKWGVNLLGMDGTIDQGMAEMREVIDYGRKNPFVFDKESMIFYTLMTLYLERDETEAWSIVKSEELNLESNLLNHFIVASVAMRTGRNDEAIRVLSACPSGSEYLSFPFLNFMLGMAKMRRLDTDATSYFLRFLDEFKGQNYIKEAYQKLAWISLINGDVSGYESYMLKCAERGNTAIDDDKQADREALSGVAPNVTLLKSRILFDGGYYKRAITLLEGLSSDDFEKQEEKVEFTYRAGRIFHESGHPDKAKGYYLATIKNGSELPLYYAANACLQTGYIYEKERDFDNAELYFRKCMNLKDHEYHNSLQQKAKAGLNRIHR